MTNSWRTTALAERHRALGSNLEDWIGMPTAWFYDHDPSEDHVAIRTRAGLMDVSGLRKLHLTGPHATAILDHATTRNAEKIMPGRSAYCCFLSEEGTFIDDGILYRKGPNDWFVVHGGGSAHDVLAPAVVGRNAALLFDDDLHDISLQGPLAVDYLAKHVPGIRDLAYFGHVSTTLFGKPVMISRTGYTGERGYEIFARGRDIVAIWDQIVAEGKEMGIVPAAFCALDALRVESYLLFFPFDNSQVYPFPQGPQGDTLWELGLDFTVSPGKTGFRGAEAHYRAKGKERFKIFGIELESDKPAGNGDPLFDGHRQVGVVTQGMVSTLTGRSLGIARLDVDKAVPGTVLELRGAELSAKAVAAELPFDDPKKLKRTAKG
ncbi:aminomethyltransferase [Sphingomonas zeicaulis]|uniref:aminomethyltransferase family protein n=1 Tax=Sphingomonas zeicaulis TaxID=1632740 RepID=UPI003D2181A2